MTDDPGSITIYGQPIRGRSCGSCKLCCTLLPVDLPEGKKPANEKCRHVFSKAPKQIDPRIGLTEVQKGNADGSGFGQQAECLLIRGRDRGAALGHRRLD